MPHFHVILTGKQFHGIMFVIQGDFNVNVKVKFPKVLFFTKNPISYMCL